MDQQRTETNPGIPGQKAPIINCHTHIFTGHHVPPLLGKSIVPWPFYRVVNLSWVFRFLHWWFDKGPGQWRFHGWFKKIARALYKFKMFLKRHFMLSRLQKIVGVWLTIHVFYILWDWLSGKTAPGQGDVNWIMKARTWLTDNHILYTISTVWLKILLVLLLLVFYKSGRNFIFFLLKRSWKLLGMIPGRQTKEIFNRYMKIGRYTFQNEQKTVFGQLEKQYPEGTGFVILPMDMEYMDAGKVRESYREQMDKLAALKEKHPNMFPFVFADPRRMIAEPDYFKYIPQDGKVILDTCFIKTFMEEHEFSGFKIYPALGYYPFDETLLPLWKYAADNQLPIMTHCVRGPMFFRGSKKSDWDFHPVFKQAMGDGQYDPLMLPETKNDEFTPNFTHPMNFLCLLKEEFLRDYLHARIEKDPGSPLKQIFGFTNANTPLKYNLGHLKICFGHYGGSDEWERYYGLDRYGYSSQFTQNPYWGIDFHHTTDGRPSGQPEQLWKYVDWYSLISSMMLQHPNVYADISYILHDNLGIMSLLKQTLQNHELRKKVLYGTDFYVVRNHKSDKNMLADMMGGLDEEDFDQIARKNPVTFLKHLPIISNNKMIIE